MVSQQEYERALAELQAQRQSQQPYYDAQREYNQAIAGRDRRNVLSQTFEGGDQGVFAPRHPGGTANFYPTTLGTIDRRNKREGLLGGEGAPGAYADILSGYTGEIGDLGKYLEDVGPFVAASLGGTSAFKRLQNLNVEDPMQAYGGGAAQINQGAQQATRQGQASLAMSGLGNSSMNAAMAQGAAGQAANQRAGLYTGLYQQRNQYMRNAAQSGLDAHRLVASLALGHNPAPRIDTSNGGAGNAALGTAAGALIGSIIPGVGTLAGAGVGGSIGAAS